MRRKRKLGVLAALTVAAAVSIAGVAMAGTASQGTLTQSLEATFTPTSLPDSGKPKGGTIATGVEITDSQQGRSAPPAVQVDIAYDEDVFFDAKGLAQCTVAEIEQLRSDAAAQQCKKAVVSKPGPPVLPSSTTTNSAVAQVGTDGNPNSQIPAVVTAFNGPPKGKKPVLLLHTDATPPGAGNAIIQVLVGTIKNTPGPGPGERGGAPEPRSKTLSVPVPPLAGGAAAIKRFEATIGKKFKVKVRKKGKTKKETHQYVSALCSDGVLDVSGVFNYNMDPAVNPQQIPTLNPTDQYPCQGT